VAVGRARVYDAAVARLPDTQLVATRPAESAGVAGACGLLIGYAVGIDNPAVLAALGVVVGAIPAVVTFLVVQGRRRGR
jgi:hypothetical protein